MTSENVSPQPVFLIWTEWNGTLGAKIIFTLDKIFRLKGYRM